MDFLSVIVVIAVMVAAVWLTWRSLNDDIKTYLIFLKNRLMYSINPPEPKPIAEPWYYDFNKTHLEFQQDSDISFK